MADGKFTVVIRSDMSKGAAVADVVDRLRALEQLYEAAASARLRPGASRVSIPRAAREHATLRILDASPDGSLVVQVAEPAINVDQVPDEYSELPAAVGQLFRKAVRAGAERKDAEIIQLFPERADQLRILHAIRDLSPTEDQEPVVLQQFDGLDHNLVFRTEHREWAENARPSLDPVVQTFNGMVKTGSLGGAPQFKLYDGARTIRLRPNSAGVPLLADLFGRTAAVTGLTIFEPSGAVKEITEITDVSPFRYETDRVKHDGRTYYLRRKITYACDASIQARGFTLSNDELGTVAFGRTLADAIDAASADFAAIWAEIASAPEGELHGGAMKLRNLLIELVDKVEG